MARSHVAVLGAHSTLVAYKVGISARKTGRTHSLMSVDHYLVVGGTPDGVEIMAYLRLSVMVRTLGQDIAHIAALHRVVTILVHKTVGSLHMTLIVGYRAGSLMMHHQLDTLGMGIVVERLDIKVGIWCHEVKHIIFLAPEPVLPANIPALHEQLVESVGRCKIDIALYVVGSGAMASVGTGL